MVELNQTGSDDSNKYDLSFMFSKKCNLSCSFCHYESGPDVQDKLDFLKLADWLETVDINRIASFGIYGGEPSLFLTENAAIMTLLRDYNKPCFVITNGTWSKSYFDMVAFLDFAARFKMHIVISGTPEHRKFQDRYVLEWLKIQQPEALTLKPEEENYHPMGRLAGKIPMNCKRKCMTWNKALRIAVQPDGTIIFQNCMGVFPVVGSISQPFDMLDDEIQKLRQHGFETACPYYKEAN